MTRFGVAVLLAGVWSSAALGGEAPVRVFFGPKAKDDPAGLYPNLKRFLESGKSTLYGSIHEFDMIVFAEDLARLSREGRDVRLAVESRWWLIPKNEAARQVLESSGVKVTQDNRSSGLNHDKFFVVDGERVWTGSTNMTETCLFYNLNDAVWVEDKEVAANYTVEFQEQEKGGFGAKSPANRPTPHPMVSGDGWSIQTLFPPEDDAMTAMTGLIGEAQKSIDLACFVFSSAKICDAVLAAQQRGVKVRVLLDNAFSSKAATAHWAIVPYNVLSKAGIPCKYDDEAAKLHHKFVVIDGKTVWLGSMNFSENGANTNDENVLIVRSPGVAGQFVQEFDRMWKTYSGEAGETGAEEENDE